MSDEASASSGEAAGSARCRSPMRPMSCPCSWVPTEVSIPPAVCARSARVPRRIGGSALLRISCDEAMSVRRAARRRKAGTMQGALPRPSAWTLRRSMSQRSAWRAIDPSAIVKVERTSFRTRGSMSSRKAFAAVQRPTPPPSSRWSTARVMRMSQQAIIVPRRVVSSPASAGERDVVGQVAAPPARSATASWLSRCTAATGDSAVTPRRIRDSAPCPVRLRSSHSSARRPRRSGCSERGRARAAASQHLFDEGDGDRGGGCVVRRLERGPGEVPGIRQHNEACRRCRGQRREDTRLHARRD